MCTISFVPLSATSKEFILTSNRDESIDRKTLLPEIYSIGNIKLFFPKDTVAGGTWIGLSERKRVVCLMNGGFEKHIRKLSYKQSRGVVVKNLLAAGDFLDEFELEQLNSTEPFTCIVVEWKEELELYRLVWNGQEKHIQKLPLQNYIWASSFLYDSQVRKNRELRFKKFSAGKLLTEEDLMKFHSSEGENKEEGLVIDKGFLKTCSITQVIKTSEEVKMVYKDLLLKGKPVFKTLVDF